MKDKTMLERAFELAKGGQVRTLDEIRRKLTREGYSAVESHLAGPSLRKQLKAMIADAEGAAGESVATGN